MNLRFFVWLALAIASFSSHAGEFFATKDGSMVLDRASGLVWMRCSFGQKWDGRSCSGRVTQLAFSDLPGTLANQNAGVGYGGHSDWQIPTVRQLLTIIECSTGYQSVDIGDGGGNASECRENSSRPTLDSFVFPNIGVEAYWSTTPIQGTRGSWVFNFYRGTTGWAHSNATDHPVRFVRVDILSREQSKLFFSVDLAQERIVADRRSVLEREAKERKEKGDRTTAQSKLIAKGAQALYLDAGRAQRNGGENVLFGVTFSAIELYELIVERFPSTEFAVKSMDQLTSMQGASSMRRAIQDSTSRAADAQRQADANASARAQCFSQVRACEGKCNQDASWASAAYVRSCNAECQRECK